MSLGPAGVLNKSGIASGGGVIIGRNNSSTIVSEISAIDAVSGITATNPSGSIYQLDIDTGIVATLTDSQTLTNKTLTSPVIDTGDINTPDIDGGTIDTATITSCDIDSCTLSSPTVDAGGITLTGGIVFTDAAASISANTTDGSDNKEIFVSGGGGTVSGSAGRGGHFALYGNDHATDAGNAKLRAGTAGTVQFGAGGSGSFVWSIDGASLSPTSNNTQDVGTSSLGVKALYMAGGTNLTGSKLTYSATEFQIFADTADGSDNKSINFSGGGATGNGRGAQIFIYGEDFAGNNGNFVMSTGSSGIFRFRAKGSAFIAELDNTAFYPVITGIDLGKANATQEFDVAYTRAMIRSSAGNLQVRAADANGEVLIQAGGTSDKIKVLPEGVVINAPTAAVADADMPNDSISFYISTLDLICKHKDNGGTVRTLNLGTFT